MIGPWPFRPYTFRALTKTFGPLWVRCDVCRRYERLQYAELSDVDYRSKTFSCSVCGGPAWLCVVGRTTERGMEDHRLDERDRPALAYLRRAFPAEMRSKRYLRHLPALWVTFWVLIRGKSSGKRGHPIRHFRHKCPYLIEF
jgi:hypothetical protein